MDALVNPQTPSAENAVTKPAMEKSASNLIRSHSIAGDLHGIHAPDPVAADILRKEPEQETYVKLNVAPIGTSSGLLPRLFLYICYYHIEWTHKLSERVDGGVHTMLR